MNTYVAMVALIFKKFKPIKIFDLIVESVDFLSRIWAQEFGYY